MKVLSDCLFFLAAAMNVLLFALMGIDKDRARRKKSRIRERTLWLCAIGLGAVGGTLGMLAFRHKTKHGWFVFGFPLLAIAQLALIFYLFSSIV